MLFAFFCTHIILSYSPTVKFKFIYTLKPLFFTGAGYISMNNIDRGLAT